MNYEQLFAGVKYYNKNYPHWTSSYQKLRRRGDEYWLHLERLSEIKVSSQVISFLNDWLCRVDYRSTSTLKKVLENLPSSYEALEEERLERIDFNSTNSEVIENIMNRFLRIRPKFGPVPASKLMHMALPQLFVMWDTRIKAKYRIPIYYTANHAKYYVRFLKMMQRQIRHALTSYSKAQDVNENEAIREISLKDNNSLPRMIDKFNFAIRDDEISICSECFSVMRYRE